MRVKAMIVATGLLAACGGPSQASEDELAAFVPPTLRLREDVVPRAQERFRTLDRNADGRLVAADFPRNGARRAARLDTDRSGDVSQAEFIAGALDRFDRADADRNGEVTPDERAVLRNAAS